MRHPPKTCPCTWKPCELSHPSSHTVPIWRLMFLEVAQILRESGSASDHLSKKVGLIVLNLTRCAQLGGDEARAEQLLPTRRQT